MTETTSPQPRPRTGSFRIKLEPRLQEPPRWYPLAVSFGAIVIALIPGWDRDCFCRRRSIPLVCPYCARFFRQHRCAFGYSGKSYTDPDDCPGLLGCFPHEIVEYRCGGTVHHGRVWRQRGCACALAACRNSAWIFIPVMMLAGMLAGALWGFIPGYLKAKFNVNEIISTLMLNYISISWINFWIFGVWSEGGFQMSPRFPEDCLVAAAA